MTVSMTRRSALLTMAGGVANIALARAHQGPYRLWHSIGG
jgi:hypothetical protein